MNLLTVITPNTAVRRCLGNRQARNVISKAGTRNAIAIIPSDFASIPVASAASDGVLEDGLWDIVVPKLGSIVGLTRGILLS